MFTSLAGRSVVITGGTKGIGKAMALRFGGVGAKVLVVSRSIEDAEAVAAEIVAAGGTAKGTAADISTMAGAKAMAAAAVDAHGGIDILCANAGIYPGKMIEEMTEEDFDHVVGTNLRGTFVSISACLPALKASKAGRVIITSSTTGPVTGYPGWSHYGASKAGQLGFMRTAAIELAPYGITVNAVIPGATMTEGLADLPQSFLDRITAAIPLKRFGTPREVANGALFLATEDAGYITGHALAVDGAMTLPEFEMALEESGSVL